MHSQVPASHLGATFCVLQSPAQQGGITHPISPQWFQLRDHTPQTNQARLLTSPSECTWTLWTHPPVLLSTCHDALHEIPNQMGLDMSLHADLLGYTFYLRGRTPVSRKTKDSD